MGFLGSAWKLFQEETYTCDYDGHIGGIQGVLGCLLLPALLRICVQLVGAYVLEGADGGRDDLLRLVVIAPRGNKSRIGPYMKKKAHVV